jgi:hypothetical protein
VSILRRLATFYFDLVLCFISRLSLATIYTPAINTTCYSLRSVSCLLFLFLDITECFSLGFDCVISCNDQMMSS